MIWIRIAVLAAAWALALAAAAGETPTAANEALRAAIQRADRAAAEQALANGADLRYRDIYGDTPLHNAAIYWGDLALIEKILAAGADPNARSNDGATPLLATLTTAHYRHRSGGPQQILAVIERLLAHGGTVQAAEVGGKSVLSIALEYKYPPLMKALIKGGARLPIDSLLIALGPLGDGDPDQLRIVMDVATPAHVTTRAADGATPLHLAVESPRNMYVVRWLVSQGADIHAITHRGTSPFAEAAFYSNLEAMRYLASLGAKMTTDEDASTPLHAAAYAPRAAPLRWLVEQGADRNAKDKWGRRPLDVALDSHRYAYLNDAERLELVTILGGTRADVARGTSSNHPLHAAVRAMDIDAVRRLLESGADPNAKNEAADTALRTAIDLSSGLPATPAQRAFGAKLLPLLLSHGARTDLYRGGSSMQTYDQYAYDLGVGELLARTKQRYPPKSR